MPTCIYKSVVALKLFPHPQCLIHSYHVVGRRFWSPLTTHHTHGYYNQHQGRLQKKEKGECKLSVGYNIMEILSSIDKDNCIKLDIFFIFWLGLEVTMAARA